MGTLQTEEPTISSFISLAYLELALQIYMHTEKRIMAHKTQSSVIFGF